MLQAYEPQTEERAAPHQGPSVMFRKILCAIGIHRWRYFADYGYKPHARECLCCGLRQVWHYGLARERGLIVWVKSDDK